MVDVIVELTRIIQEVSQVSTPSEQVSVIVDEISRCLDVDVCSLYRLDANGDHILLATHGLKAKRPIIIPAGKGLVGLVVKSRHTINLSNGLNHSDYYHIEDVLEENFKSFCGAPLVSNGEVIGVLVVQSEKAQMLSGPDEAFMTTLASHIALIVKQLPQGLVQPGSRKMLKGIPASEGVAVAYAYVCQKESLADVAILHNTNPDAEKEKWRRLLHMVHTDLNTEKTVLGENLSADIKNMFDAYKMLLFDQTITDRVESGIADGFSLQTSLKHTIQHFADLFHQMDDLYLKARSEDLWHIGNKLYQTFLGTHKKFDIGALNHNSIILVGHEISVSDIAVLPQNKLKGIICSGGSRLSHTAIVANALGIPAVMGIESLLKQDLTGQIIVDGTEGTVFLHASRSILAEYLAIIEKEKGNEKALLAYKNQPAITQDNVRIHLMANSGLLSDISPGLKNGAEGVGLFRTEIPFLISATFPTEKEQFDIYRNVFRNYQNKPVYMRTLDIGGDKQLPYFPITGEENPALGWRGIRFTLDNIQLLMTQIRAMLKAAGTEGELNILLPMVSSIDELKTFHGVLDDAVDQLLQENLSVKRPKVGVMIEVPAAISQIKFWASHIDFVSIGSNDLSQYILAVDRNNPRVAARFDHVHPAVIFEVYRTVKEAAKYKLPLCVCGEMASDPISVILLVAMGVDKLSMNASKIPKIKSLIRNLNNDVAQRFLKRSLKKDCAKKIRQDGSKLIEDLRLLEHH